jgi:phosphate starvation-inducible PhoH-like protein
MTKKARSRKSVESSEQNINIADSSPKIFQGSKINFELTLRERNDYTEKQKAILEAALKKDTRCIFIDGLYGSGKTLIAVLAALRLLNQKKISEIVYVRNPVESTTTGKLGYLKGEAEQKMAPYLEPLEDKLKELLPLSEINKLKNEERIHGLPIGFARGRSYNATAIIVDEASSMSYDDLFLIMSRCGPFTRIFLCGDSLNQNDIGNKAGFLKMIEKLNDQESVNNGVYVFELKDYEDIKRSGFLRFLMVKTGLIKKPEAISENDIILH